MGLPRWLEAALQVLLILGVPFAIGWFVYVMYLVVTTGNLAVWN